MKKLLSNFATVRKIEVSKVLVACCLFTNIPLHHDISVTLQFIRI